MILPFKRFHIFSLSFSLSLRFFLRFFLCFVSQAHTHFSVHTTTMFHNEKNNKKNEKRRIEFSELGGICWRMFAWVGTKNDKLYSHSRKRGVFRFSFVLAHTKSTVTHFGRWWLIISLNAKTQRRFQFLVFFFNLNKFDCVAVGHDQQNALFWFCFYAKQKIKYINWIEKLHTTKTNFSFCRFLHSLVRMYVLTKVSHRKNMNVTIYVGISVFAVRSIHNRGNEMEYEYNGEHEQNVYCVWRNFIGFEVRFLHCSYRFGENDGIEIKNGVARVSADWVPLHTLCVRCV